MNSSIFNFDPLRKAAALGRDTRRWHAVLMLSAVLILLTTSLFLSIVRKNNVETTYRAIGALKEAQILVLGDSQLRMLAAEAFGVPTQNRAMQGSDYELQALLLENLTRRAPELKLVILELDVLPLLVCGIERRNGDYRDVCALGVPWWRLRWLSIPEKLSYWIRYNALLAPVLVGPKYELPDPYPIDVASRNLPQSQPTGPQPAAGFALLPSEGRKKMENYMLTFKKRNNRNRNEQAFLSMLDYCWERNLKVALLTPPQTPEFLRVRPKEWTKKMLDIWSEAQRRAPENRLEIWDLQGEGIFRIEEFADPNHIAEESNAHYSQVVAERAQAFLAK